LNREQLLAKAKRRYVECEGVRMQSLTELELSNLRGLWAKRYSDMEKGQFDPVAMAKAPRELLACVLVNDDGSRMFTSSQEDLDAIGGLDPEFFGKLHDAARSHVGLDRDDPEVDRNEGKSEEATA
jgi:hypothetical protein